MNLHRFKIKSFKPLGLHQIWAGNLNAIGIYLAFLFSFLRIKKQKFLFSRW
jgi:hypothetical protein